MKKSATDIMQEIVYSAVVDSIVALKAGSQGLPNALLRTLNGIHANTTFSDLPPELQAAITNSVRSAFTRLLKEGYSISSGTGASATPQRDTRRSPGAGPRPGKPTPRRHGPNGGGRPDRGGKPRPPKQR